MHTTSSSLPKVVDQLLACMDVGSCVVSLAKNFLTRIALTRTSLRNWIRRQGERCGTGRNRREPGFVMDKLVITLAAVSQRVEHAKALRIVDASKRRLPCRKKLARA